MFALVDANSFYAACERVFRPDLANRPVVVLSNNDGCIVARSKQAKELGIEMGVPYFQVKAMLQRNHVAVFSSNYTLYSDMSRRTQEVLRLFSDDMEVYSIDESFLHWSAEFPWQNIGEEILDKVQRWTGLPVGAGFGPTKTLAKLANRAKGATGVHVLDNAARITAALGNTELGNIWGISGGFIRRLAKLGVTTPLQLRGANPLAVRRAMGVVGERIVYELRGESCIPLECVTPNKQNICCSRSFGQVTNNPDMMREAVGTFASQAAVKLRRQDLAAERLVVFIQTDRHAEAPQYAASWPERFPPTNDTRELARHATACLQKIFRPEYHYKKAGVLLMDLCRREQVAPSLFEDRNLEASNRLMQLMDKINGEHGRGTIRLASCSPQTLNACRTWHLRSEHCSPRYTTQWDELPLALAKHQGFPVLPAAPRSEH